MDVECISPHRCIRSTSRNTTLLTEHSGWILAGVLGHRKGPYRSVHDWVGWKERRRAYRARPASGVEWKRGRGSCCWFWSFRVYFPSFSLMLWWLFSLLLFIFRLWDFFLIILFTSFVYFYFYFGFLLHCLFKFCVAFCFLFGVSLVLFVDVVLIYTDIFYIYFYFTLAFLNFFLLRFWSFFPLLCSSAGTLLWFCFLFCALVLSLIG